MRTLLRFFFYLLYHPFAFMYDLVASTVSLGRWNDWVLSVVPFIDGDRILEIGHGPGHLQRVLLNRHLLAVGIDESAPMGHLAKRNLMRFTDSKTHDNKGPNKQQSAYAQYNLTRGLGQQLPFPNESFDTVVATFPAEYIFNVETFAEAHRILAKDGRFVVLPGATILGHGIIDRAMAYLFRITGQTPPNLDHMLRERFKEPIAETGFHVQIHKLELKSSRVFILVATKSPH